MLHMSALMMAKGLLIATTTHAFSVTKAFTGRYGNTKSSLIARNMSPHELTSAFRMDEPAPEASDKG